MVPGSGQTTTEQANPAERHFDTEVITPVVNGAIETNDTNTYLVPGTTETNQPVVEPNPLFTEPLGAVVEADEREASDIDRVIEAHSLEAVNVPEVVPANVIAQSVEQPKVVSPDIHTIVPVTVADANRLVELTNEAQAESFIMDESIEVDK